MAALHPVLKKLVRDHLPDRVYAAEKKHMNVSEVADDGEFRRLLALKLEEEAQEFAEKPSAEELADIDAVVAKICQTYGFAPERVRDMRRGRYGQTDLSPHRVLITLAAEFTQEPFIECIADFCEVFDAVCASSPELSRERVQAARARKREERGEFDRRLAWDYSYL